VGHLSTRIEDLLVAEACKRRPDPFIKPGEPALTRDRHSHVDRNCVRTETHDAADDRLIEAQAGIEIAGLSGGESARLVDGLGFVVPLRTIDTAPTRGTSAANAAAPGSTRRRERRRR
jgi:Tn3 transposase DDE domain